MSHCHGLSSHVTGECKIEMQQSNQNAVSLLESSIVLCGALKFDAARYLSMQLRSFNCIAEEHIILMPVLRHKVVMVEISINLTGF